MSRWSWLKATLPINIYRLKFQVAFNLIMMNVITNMIEWSTTGTDFDVRAHDIGRRF